MKRTFAALLVAFSMGNAAANVAPTVSMTGPVGTTNFIAKATVPLSATAADTDGTVSKVVFYNGATVLGTVTAAPYTFNWLNVVAGSYSITAKATDSSGAVTTSAAIPVVVKPNALPTVALAGPTANAVYVAPAGIPLSAVTADSDGAVTNVMYYHGTSYINQSSTPPFNVTWVATVPGTYVLKAKASDDKGGSTMSPTVTAIVNPNSVPTVTITTPASGSSFAAPGVVPLTATASDNDGVITKVAFYNGATLIGTDTTAPYAFNWANVAVGSYTVTAKATDEKGGVTTSAPVTVTVNANAPPTVSILNPVQGASFGAPANIALTALAADNDGKVAKVAFYRGGTTLIGTATVAPFNVNWANAAAGNYSLTAVATDDKGAVATSAAVAVAVKTNSAPTVGISSPANNTTHSGASPITLTANAADSDGNVAKVEFYRGTTLIGTATAAPFTVTWSNAPVGTHSVTAKATDNAGASTVSAAVAVIVSNNAAPTVSLAVTPADAVAPAAITMTATASDADGSVAKVEFYNGTALLKTVTQAPYTYVWTAVAAGSYSLTARVTDNLGAQSTSSASAVQVGNGAAKVYYIYSDQIETAREIVDATGAKVWEAGTEAFGANPPNENPAGKGAFKYKPRFPGQYYDGETGLHYNYYRDYDPQTGRYVQSDPIGLKGGINTFGYVGGNPLSLVDPLGLFGWADMPTLPPGAVNFSAGVGDGILATLSFGIVSGQGLRKGAGISGGVNKCTPEYRGGQLTGTAATLGFYAGAAIPKLLTHYTTAAGAAGIGASGAINASTGLTLFGDGIYATSGSRLFVPSSATIPLVIEGTGFIRLIPNAAFLKGGSFQTAAIFAGYGFGANTVAESEAACTCQ